MCVCVFAFVLSSVKVSVCLFLCLFAFVLGSLCVRVSVCKCVSDFVRVCVSVSV